MRIVLFCENKYAIDILKPIGDEANREGGNDVLWYVHRKRIADFPLKDEVAWTGNIQEVYDFHPEAIFVPGNIVPYYLSGVKIQVFHGYAAEKKDHWVIRRYFDTYFTQGPFFTKGFERLARKYKDFEVLETGWPRQDWIFRNLHSFDAERERLLKESGRSKIVLYAPTFSPSLTSLPYMQQALVDFVRQKDVLLLLKFHPLTKPELMDEYRQLAASTEGMLWIDDYTVTKYMLMADAMISDTSSTIYEFLLLDKPVITLRAVAKDLYWRNMAQPEELCQAYDEVIDGDEWKEKRRWVIENYDPYLDGKVAHRMLEGARDYIRRNGVPPYRRLNLWRKYTSIKTFGRLGNWSFSRLGKLLTSPNDQTTKRPNDQISPNDQTTKRPNNQISPNDQTPKRPNDQIIGVILAAGMAKRLRPLTDTKPKCLLEVGNRTLLQRTVDAMAAVGISEFVVVTGYRAEMIRNFIAEHYPQYTFHFLHNADYEHNNNIYSLWMAGQKVRGKSFLLMDSDILCDPEAVAEVARQSVSALALNRHELGEEEMKIVVDGQNNITEISKTCRVEDAAGESVGIEKMTPEYSEALFRELDKMIEQEGLIDIFYERAFERLIPQGHTFKVVDTTRFFSYELDTPEDFENAKQLIPEELY